MMILLGIFFSCAYMAAFAFAGLNAASFALPGEKAGAKVMLGLAFGLAMMMWLPALFSFALGAFTLITQVLALFAALIIAIALRHRLRNNNNSLEQNSQIIRQSPLHKSMQFLRNEKVMLIVCIPFFALCAYLLFTHTLLPKNGAYYTGQSTFGDMNLHLGFITSIAAQGFFPPDYSILPGTAVGYPFLNASVSSTLLLLGAPLRAAYIMPSLWAIICVLMGIYSFFQAWFKRTGTAALALVLFLLGGGFGVWYFLDGSGENPGNFLRIFTAFYETPTNYTIENVRWVNAIADMLIPQRATLYGWALLFPALYLLRRGYDGEKTFIPLGILAGALPLVHTHSFMALALISLPIFLYECAKGKDAAKRYLLYIIIAAALALPQLFAFTFKQSAAEGFLRPHFNWANEGDSYLWFYVKNLGLFALLLPATIAFAGKEHRRFSAGALLILLLCECVVFQPNEYDNNKLLFVAFALMCGLTAHFLTGVYERLSGMAGRRALSAVTLTMLLLSGALTLGREAVSHLAFSDGEVGLAFELYSAANVAAAEWAKENTPPDATFLTAPNHNNAISSLSGRNIVCGTDTFLYFHGVDTQSRHDAVRRMYTEYGAFEALKDEYSVDYVYISNHEWYDPGVDSSIFAGYPVVFSMDDVRIVDVRN